MENKSVFESIVTVRFAIEIALQNWIVYQIQFIFFNFRSYYILNQAFIIPFCFKRRRIWPLYLVHVLLQNLLPKSLIWILLQEVSSTYFTLFDVDICISACLVAFCLWLRWWTYVLDQICFIILHFRRIFASKWLFKF